MTTRRGTHKGEVPEVDMHLASHLLQKQRLCKYRPYPLRMWREQRNGRDRTSTGPHDALDVQGWKR